MPGTIGTQARRIGRSWELGILLVLLALIATGGIKLTIDLFSGESAAPAVSQPFDAAQSKPVAQPVRQVPATVAPVKERQKVHVEWTQIGTARNGNEVVALGIPRGDELISVPVEVVENLPPGATGILGFPTENGTVILYTYIESEPWVLTYWKTKTEIPLSALKGPNP